jgi:predicted O-methyltransferase YrrM
MERAGIVTILLGLIIALLVTGAWVLARKLRRLRSMLRRQERHVWETHNIFLTLAGGAALPLPGGWAASTDLLGEVLRVIAERRPQCVVELGSGLSTLVIAAALRSNGRGHLISIDAEADYAASTRAQLQRQGLAEWADIRVAPLREQSFEDSSRPWYDMAQLEDLDGVDLLFIDGPPTYLRADIRYPALPFFWKRLRSGATVLLDDAARPAERAMSQVWQRRFIDARFEFLRLEKGALRVTKSSATHPG